jgi:membrane protease YdiL (CAAX protease family)
VDWVLLALLLVVVPALSLVQLLFIDDVPIERLPAYWSSIVALWLIGLSSLLIGTRDGRGLEGVGVVLLGPAETVLWAGLLTAMGMGVLFIFREISARLGAGETRLLRALLPATAAERGTFVLLSLTAGVCEEVAYRGYAMSALIPSMGGVAAAAATSVVFGVLHGYQGRLGMVRAGLMGGVLAWGFLATGSIVPSIIAHTLIDILAGVVLGERLLPPEELVGV